MLNYRIGPKRSDSVIKLVSDLITDSDQAVRAVHSCKSWFLSLIWQTRVSNVSLVLDLERVSFDSQPRKNQDIFILVRKSLNFCLLLINLRNVYVILADKFHKFRLVFRQITSDFVCLHLRFFFHF